MTYPVLDLELLVLICDFGQRLLILLFGTFSLVLLKFLLKTFAFLLRFEVVFLGVIILLVSICKSRVQDLTPLSLLFGQLDLCLKRLLGLSVKLLHLLKFIKESAVLLFPLLDRVLCADTSLQ